MYQQRTMLSEELCLKVGIENLCIRSEHSNSDSDIIHNRIVDLVLVLIYEFQY